ncbi:MAG: tetratricopeptide repeat protein, partial [Spirochaetaceae bacterium]|nr:tetratricopeptide repeat protein [Spirochaetaceae bacterium]
MLYVYIEVRYKKQLEKINSPAIEKLNNALERVCVDHGGEIFRHGTILFAGFDENCVGYLFGAARTLLTIQSGLHTNRKWIGEYAILADSSEATEEVVFQNLQASSNKILREDGIFCLPAAAAQLKEYLVFGEDVFPRTIGTMTVIGNRLEQEGTIRNSSTEKTFRYPILSGGNTNILTALRNCFGLLPQNEIEMAFTNEERTTAKKLRFAMKAFERSRFDIQIPDYIQKNLIELCRLYFRGAVTLSTRSRKSVQFYLQSSENLKEEFTNQLRELCAPIPVKFLSNEEDISISFEHRLTEIPTDLLEIGYLIFRAVEYLYMDELFPFFAYLGKKKVYLDSALEQLCNCGLLEWKNRQIIPNLNYKKHLIHILRERCDSLDVHLGNFLWQNYCDCTLTASFGLYRTLKELKIETSESFLLSCIYAFLEEEPWKHYPELLTKEALTAILRVSPEQAVQILDLIRCRQLLLSGIGNGINIDTLEASSEITAFEHYIQKGESLLECAIALECSHWYYGSGLLPKAMNTVKNVLQKVQFKKNRQGEYRCFALLALIHLTEGHISDSTAYFEYANDCADAAGGILYHLRARCNLGMIHFIEGNFSRCIKLLDADIPHSWELFDRNMLVFIVFFKGRCFFELGNYERAKEEFSQAREFAQELLLPDAAVLAHVWLGRVLSCQGRRVEAEHIFKEYQNSIPDAFLFYAESCILNERGTISAEDAKNSIDMFSRQLIWYNEHFIWTSGFRFAEDFCYAANRNNSADT